MLPRCISRRGCRISPRIGDHSRWCACSALLRLHAIYRVCVAGRVVHGPRAPAHRVAQVETRRLRRRTHETEQPLPPYGRNTVRSSHGQTWRLTRGKTAGAAESKHIPILRVRSRVRLPRSRAAHGHLKFRPPPKHGDVPRRAHSNRYHLHQFDELRISVQILFLVTTVSNNSR